MFAERSLPDSENCMGRGFECGDGWFELINSLCGTIQFWVNQVNMPPVHVTQVKEKLSTLRFRYRGGDERTDGIVRMAEAMSERICEVCGAPGYIQPSSTDLVIRCRNHASQGAAGGSGSLCPR